MSEGMEASGFRCPSCGYDGGSRIRKLELQPTLHAIFECGRCSHVYHWDRTEEEIFYND